MQVLLHLLTAGVGTFRTSQDVRLESAKWGKADLDQVAVTNRNFMSTRPRTRNSAKGDLIKALARLPENCCTFSAILFRSRFMERSHSY
jgi:hypothetical protein